MCNNYINNCTNNNREKQIISNTNNQRSIKSQIKEIEKQPTVIIQNKCRMPNGNNNASLQQFETNRNKPIVYDQNNKTEFIRMSNLQQFEFIVNKVNEQNNCTRQ